MNVYQVACEECDMDTRTRRERLNARKIATKHAAETGHATTVMEFGGGEETVVYETC